MYDKVTLIPRMRTVPQIKAFFAENGEAGISSREIRRLAKTGAVPSIMAGRKLLLSLDGLLNYLSSNTLQSQEHSEYGKIRRIE